MTDRLFQLRRLCHAGAAILIALSWSPIADAVTNAVVERGRYLAIAGNCVACHTKPGGKPHAGGLKFDTPFGVLYSTNITPDRATGIGNWSLAQFIQPVIAGINRLWLLTVPLFRVNSWKAKFLVTRKALSPELTTAEKAILK